MFLSPGKPSWLSSSSQFWLWLHMLPTSNGSTHYFAKKLKQSQTNSDKLSSVHSRQVRKVRIELIFLFLVFGFFVGRQLPSDVLFVVFVRNPVAATNLGDGCALLWCGVFLTLWKTTTTASTLLQITLTSNPLPSPLYSLTNNLKYRNLNVWIFYPKK